MYDDSVQVESYGCDFEILTNDQYEPELAITFRTNIGELTLPFDSDQAEDLGAVCDAYLSYVKRQQRNYH